MEVAVNLDVEAARQDSWINPSEWNEEFLSSLACPELPFVLAEVSPSLPGSVKPVLTNGYFSTQKLGWARSTALSARAHGLLSRRGQITLLGKPWHSVCHSPGQSRWDALLPLL